MNKFENKHKELNRTLEKFKRTPKMMGRDYNVSDFLLIN